MTNTFPLTIAPKKPYSHYFHMNKKIICFSSSYI